MEQFEYYTYIYNPEGFFGGKVDTGRLQMDFNQFGRDGWELVSTVSTNEAYGQTKSIVCFFKRRIMQ